MHYVPYLAYITLHYVAGPCITLHDSTLQDIAHAQT